MAQNPADTLLSLPSVRRRSSLLLPSIHSNTLAHFTVSLPHLHSHVLPAVISTIKSYIGTSPPSSIPPHGRWQHFSIGSKPRLDDLITQWQSTGVDKHEQVRRVLDLTVISVLLDAGAGNAWSYTEDGTSYSRSEGLAVASFHMFTSGLFSSDTTQPYRVDAAGLASLAPESLASGLQVTPTNPISGLKGRTKLLQDLGTALRQPAFFGEEGRPGNMLGYLLSYPTGDSLSEPPVIDVQKLWRVLTKGLGSIWPVRTTVEGRNVGDAWHYAPLKDLPGNELRGARGQSVMPFHKLTQWLCYSLLIPFKRMLHATIVGEELLTGLPEYRNGGLFVDYGVLTLRPADEMETVPEFEAGDEVVVEWRAATVCLLDMLLPMVNEALGLEGEEKLSLAQMLEAGSWAAGRAVAAERRPVGKEPPIGIVSDGTVF